MASISAERASLAKVGMTLRRREQWGARRSYTDSRTVVEPARQVFIHVSVTNPAAYNSHAAHVRAIEAIGINRFPSTGISYNRIIVFGVNTAYEAQPMGRRGAHTVNDFGYTTCQRWGAQCPGRGGSFNTAGHGTNLNYTARAYCYGALCEASATDSVLDTFARTIAADMKAGLVRRDAEIHGHRCVSAKSCPCGMWSRMHDLRRRIDHYLGSDLEDDDMEPTDKISLSDSMKARLGGHDALSVGALLGYGGAGGFSYMQDRGRLISAQTKTLAELAAIRAAVGGVEVDVTALATELAPLLVAPIVAELGDETGLTEEQAERVLRRVLGSLDDD